MNHLALYRKFRPKNFDEIIGQDHIVRVLKNQIESKEVSHAYLFCGSRGTGKTSMARIFALSINCENPKNGSPCYECEACKALQNQSNLDILEIDAASNNRVDEIRDLREKVKYTPINGKYKVYIIDEVHMLTESAFNALLKTLEEPPAHAVFILATTEVHKLPSTILSRVMRFDVKLVSQEKLAKHLTGVFKNLGVKAEKEAINLIAAAGEGSVRDMLSIADMCYSYCGKEITYENVLSVLGISNKEILIDLSDAILNSNSKQILELTEKLAISGKNFSVIAKDLTTHLRDLLVIKNLKDANNVLNLPEKTFEKMQKQTSNIQETDVLVVMKNLSSIESNLKYAVNPRILFETMALSAVMENKVSNAGLAGRIDALEKVLASGNLPEKKTKLESNGAKPAVINKKVETVEKTAPKKAENLQSSEEAKIIWAKILLKLKEIDTSVYVMCSDALEVFLQEDTIVLNIKEKTLKERLELKGNNDIIQNVLKQLGLNYKIKFNLLEEKSINKQDIESILKDKFKDKLKIV